MMNETNNLELENGKLRLRCRHLQETLSSAHDTMKDMREEIQRLKLKIKSLQVASTEEVEDDLTRGMITAPDVSEIFSDVTGEAKIIKEMFHAYRCCLLVNGGLLSMNTVSPDAGQGGIEEEQLKSSYRLATKFAILSKLLISKNFCQLLLHAYGELKTFSKSGKLLATTQNGLELTDTSFISSSQRTEFYDAEDFSSLSQKGLNEIESRSANMSEASCIDSSDTMDNNKMMFFDWLRDWIFHFINLIEQRQNKFMEFSVNSLKVSFDNFKSIQNSILDKMNQHLKSICNQSEQEPFIHTVRRLALFYTAPSQEDFEILFLHLNDNHLENIKGMMPTSEMGTLLIDSKRLLESRNFMMLIDQLNKIMQGLKKALVESSEQSIEDSESYIRCSLAMLDIFLYMNDIFAGKCKEASSRMLSTFSDVTEVQEFQKCEDVNQVWKTRILQKTFVNTVSEDMCLRFERIFLLLGTISNQLISNIHCTRIELWIDVLVNLTRWLLALLEELQEEDFEIVKFILGVENVFDGKHLDIQQIDDADNYTEFYSQESETPVALSVEDQDLEKFVSSPLPSFASTASFQFDLPAVFHQVEMMQGALEKSSCEIEALRTQMKCILSGHQSRQSCGTQELGEPSVAIYEKLESKIFSTKSVESSHNINASTDSLQNVQHLHKSDNALLYSLWIHASWMKAMFDKGYSLKSLIAGIAIDLKRAINLSVDVKVIYQEFAKVVKETSSFTSDGALYILFVVHSDDLKLEDYRIVMQNLQLRNSVYRADSWISNENVKDIKFEGPISKHIVMLLDTVINSGGNRGRTMEGCTFEFEKLSQRDVTETLELSIPASLISFSTESDEGGSIAKQQEQQGVTL
eukprot:759438-Hanusia_phi.AAC.9